MRKFRTKKLQPKSRLFIIQAYATGNYTMAELAGMFAVSQGRICQIVNDTYKERESLESYKG